MNCRQAEELLAMAIDDEVEADAAGGADSSAGGDGAGSAAETAAELAAHLKGCAACREFERRLGGLATFCQGLPPVTTRERTDALLRDIVSSLTPSDELPAGDIWTVEEVARYLKVAVEDVYSLVDRMPFFSFGEQLRIRRERLIAWIEAEEERMHRSVSLRSVAVRR